MKLFDTVKFESVHEYSIPDVNNGKVVAIQPYEDAIKKDFSIDIKNRDICTMLNKPITDITGDVFYTILVNGEKVIYAESWIEPSSITEPPSKQDIVITVLNVNDTEKKYITMVLNFLKLKYVIK